MYHYGVMSKLLSKGHDHLQAAAGKVADVCSLFYT